MKCMTILVIILLIIIFCLIFTDNTEKIKYKNSIDYPVNQTFYWINLEKCIDRRQNMQKIFNDYNIKNVRIDAILGERTDYAKNKACTLSHVKAIQTFYDSGDDIGIICEDDLTMEYKKYWRESIDDVVANAPKDWEIIQLSVIVHRLVYELTIKSAKSKYIPYHPWVFGALCYIINRKGAKKLIKVPNDPVPSSERYIYNAKTYIYKYPMFTYPSENDSLIHPTHLSLHNASKNIITNYLKYK